MRSLALAFIVTLLSSAFIVQPVSAQRRQPGPSAEATQRAREAYARGQTLFNEGSYDEAAAAFEEAFAAVPNPVVLVSLGEARERGGNLTAAVETYERYLAARTDAPDRARIEGKIQELRARPARLAVSSTPSGASIRVDGEATGDVTPAEVEVPPGSHTIGLEADGFEPAEESVEVTFGEQRDVAVELTAAPEAVEEIGEGEGEELGEEEEIVEAPAREGKGVSPGVWAASAIAGVGLVTGTVLGFLALSDQAEFDDTPSDETADRGETFALFADVAFGVAAAAAITAVVLYLTSDDGNGDDDESEASTEARLEVTPVVGTEGGGISANVRF